MHTNLLGKVFLGAVAAYAVKKTLCGPSDEQIKEVANQLLWAVRNYDWYRFNVVIDQHAAHMSYEERCATWTKIMNSPTAVQYQRRPW